MPVLYAECMPGCSCHLLLLHQRSAKAATIAMVQHQQCSLLLTSVWLTQSAATLSLMSLCLKVVAATVAGWIWQWIQVQ